jgi:hypothetical protein
MPLQADERSRRSFGFIPVNTEKTAKLHRPLLGAKQKVRQANAPLTELKNDGEQ